MYKKNISCYLYNHNKPQHSVITVYEPVLTLKHREMHWCVVSTVATDALVRKQQAISIHNVD